jgi:hypothetical protein
LMEYTIIKPANIPLIMPIIAPHAIARWIIAQRARVDRSTQDSVKKTSGSGHSDWEPTRQHLAPLVAAPAGGAVLHSPSARLGGLESGCWPGRIQGRRVHAGSYRWRGADPMGPLCQAVSGSPRLYALLHRTRLAPLLPLLTDRERYVVVRRFGLGGQRAHPATTGRRRAWPDLGTCEANRTQDAGADAGCIAETGAVVDGGRIQALRRSVIGMPASSNGVPRVASKPTGSA